MINLKNILTTPSLTLILFLLTCNLFCQNKKEFLLKCAIELDDSTFRWVNIETVPNDTLKQLALRTFHSDTTIFHYPDSIIKANSEEDYLKENNNELHFLDINNDGNLDFIYYGQYFNGYYAYNSTFVFIYIFIENKFVLTNSYTGRPIVIQKDKDHNFDIVIGEYPCCATYMNIYTYFHFDNDKFIGQDSIVFVKGLMHGCGDNLPTKINPAKTITISKGTDIRYEPFEKYELRKGCDIFDPKRESGNLIGKINDDIKAYYYSHHEDESGQKWYFIEINTNQFDNILRIKNSYNQSLQSVFGWICK